MKEGSMSTQQRYCNGMGFLITKKAINCNIVDSGLFPTDVASYLFGANLLSNSVDKFDLKFFMGHPWHVNWIR